MPPIRSLIPQSARAGILSQFQARPNPALTALPVPVKTQCRNESVVVLPGQDEHIQNSKHTDSPLPPLSRLPLHSLLRSMVLSSIFSSPLLLRPSLFVSSKLAHSKSRFLDPDRNVLLRMLLKPLVYDHFCAGTNDAEVKATIANLKKQGFSGVALCHGKELLEESKSSSKKAEDAVVVKDANIESWRKSNLQTLNMVSEGDVVAIKFSGAGSAVTEALEADIPPPEQFWNAMHEICNEAVNSGKVLWIDAEKQLFQHTIDQWTIELMREYNKNDQCTIYNTIQCYLKASADNVAAHVQLAQNEGWSLGLKLVRGAYIDYETRELIHDTKEETDAAYDSITESLLRKRIQGVDSRKFPLVKVALASHNAESIEKASVIARELVLAGEEVHLQGCAQLLGMADEVSCKLVQDRVAAKSTSGPTAAQEVMAAPRAFKYITWGSVQECMGYLHRRAVENSGAAGRMKEDLAHMRAELWRRMTASIRAR